MLKGISPHDTIELIAYANEEPPYFGTEQMAARSTPKNFIRNR